MESDKQMTSETSAADIIQTHVKPQNDKNTLKERAAHILKKLCRAPKLSFTREAILVQGLLKAEQKPPSDKSTTIVLLSHKKNEDGSYAQFVELITKQLQDLQIQFSLFGDKLKTIIVSDEDVAKTKFKLASLFRIITSSDFEILGLKNQKYTLYIDKSVSSFLDDNWIELLNVYYEKQSQKLVNDQPALESLKSDVDGIQSQNLATKQTKEYQFLDKIIKISVYRSTERINSGKNVGIGKPTSFFKNKTVVTAVYKTARCCFVCTKYLIFIILILIALASIGSLFVMPKTPSGSFNTQRANIPYTSQTPKHSTPTTDRRRKEL